MLKTLYIIDVIADYLNIDPSGKIGGSGGGDIITIEIFLSIIILVIFGLS